MAEGEAKAIEILGGRALLRGRAPTARKAGAARSTAPAKGSRPAAKGAAKARLAPGDLRWTGLIRAGLPARSTQTLASSLDMSVKDLAVSLRLPVRTVHRRLEKGEPLTPEESERAVRAARVLAKAEDLLGEVHGRGWVRAPCRALGGEIPITLLDTADGFTAVMDELGRLEHGVLS
ncbi:antitoxin Xre/MbcA/ParS toxin-binding domain-containing protein [Anaeromyxobacter sp. PSR-1]|uniref:type II RES/Xre toxin-antitoxin system antitoxin n=1 Tax=unclassified Anaeromyxobacter TaxID=2620896 RepID=UPI0005E365F7|nr:antitoxin Xre/MbcA/ParS toxin-binding domain-containing protein [Anaeromyxobacter sp. PSR-1]GAO01840.1 hypothetical protein PSR1_00701 [Anaeromyxobacter sp. PSR-1]